jgi:hypothetical protein
MMRPETTTLIYCGNKSKSGRKAVCQIRISVSGMRQAKSGMRSLALKVLQPRYDVEWH